MRNLVNISNEKNHLSEWNWNWFQWLTLFTEEIWLILSFLAFYYNIQASS